MASIINFTLTEVGYLNRPAINVNLSLYGAATPKVNITFEYVLASEREPYVADDSTYLTDWVLTNACQSSLYVTMVKNVSDYTVNVYQDSGKTSLICTGTGTSATPILLTANNNSGVTGSVVKTATASSGNENIVLTDATVWTEATNIGTDSLTGLIPSTVGSGRGYLNYYWDIYNDLPAEVNDTYHFRIAAVLQAPGTDVIPMRGKSVELIKQIPTTTLVLANYTNQKKCYFILDNIQA